MSSTPVIIGRPEASEHLPYYEKYIKLVENADIVGALQEQMIQTQALLSAVGEAKGDFRYAPDKWNVKEVLGHLIDTERIMAYRALRIARNDATPIEGFEQDDYVRNAPHRNCRVKDLAGEFATVREASVFLFRSLDAEAWMRRGIANRAEITVRALAYIIAGHELHHRKMLVEKYLS